MGEGIGYKRNLLIRGFLIGRRKSSASKQLIFGVLKVAQSNPNMTSFFVSEEV